MAVLAGPGVNHAPDEFRGGVEVIRGADVPGRWILVDRQFRPVEG
jgi:hypothetical protein